MCLFWLCLACPLTNRFAFHSILTVIEKILNEDWNDGDGRKEDPPTNATQVRVLVDGARGKHRAVPEPEGDDPDDPCVDCYKCASTCPTPLASSAILELIIALFFFPRSCLAGEFSDDFSKKKLVDPSPSLNITSP